MIRNKIICNNGGMKQNKYNAIALWEGRICAFTIILCGADDGPTVAQENYILLPEQRYELEGPSLANCWHINPPFSNSFGKANYLYNMGVYMTLINYYSM